MGADAPQLDAPRSEAAHPRPVHFAGLRATGRVLARRYWRFGVEDVLVLLVVLVFVLPSRLVYLPMGAEGRPATLLGLLLFLWWCLMKLVPRLSPRGRQPLRLALWVFLVVLLISWLAGLDRGPLPIETRAMDRTMLARASIIGVALVVADGVRTRRGLDRLLIAVMYGGAFMGMVAALQFIFNYDIVPFLKFPPLELNAELPGARLRGAGLRVASTAGHSIELGVVVAMILPIAMHYAFRSGTNNRRIFRWSAVALLAASIPFSGSRSGYVGFAVVLLTMTWAWNTRARFNALVVTAFGLAVVRAASPGLLGTMRYLFLNLGADESVAGRTEDYDVVFEYIWARPFFGRGPGTFIPDEYIVLDNELLGTIVTIGFVGLLALVAVVIVALVHAGWAAHHARSNEARHLAQALKASILVGVFSSLTFDSLGFATFSAVWFLCFGAVAALWRIEKTGVGTEIDPEDKGDYSRLLNAGRLTDPSEGQASLAQITTDMVHDHAGR